MVKGGINRYSLRTIRTCSTIELIFSLFYSCCSLCVKLLFFWAENRCEYGPSHPFHIDGMKSNKTIHRFIEKSAGPTQKTNPEIPLLFWFRPCTVPFTQSISNGVYLLLCFVANRPSLRMKNPNKNNNNNNNGQKQKSNIDSSNSKTKNHKTATWTWNNRSG